jgi:hypothetical protein
MRITTRTPRKEFFPPVWHGVSAGAAESRLARALPTVAPKSSPHRRVAHATVSLPSAYLTFLGFVLAGYALFGKGFAYIGVPPLFIGEAALLIGICICLGTRNWRRVFDLPATRILAPLVIWGIFRTVPYIGQYQFDAFRDAAVFGYCGFAIMIGIILLADPARLDLLIEAYRKFWRFFLVAIPIIAVIYRFGRGAIPNWPWADVPIVFVKEGDIMVHLAAILAFWAAGFEKHVSWFWLVLMAFSCATIGVVDRAGMLAFIAVAGTCFILKPRHPAVWRLLSLCLLAVFFLWITDIKLEIPGGKGREVSFRQFVINTGSLFGADVGDHGLDSNKDWRLNWWSDVADYTLHGKYFWTGKGYGINLADDDGYQLFADGSLRSPHSAHITFLARGGVPGVILWLAVPLVWGASIFRAYLKSRRERDERWQSTFAFLGAFGIALLVNASFDVYLEGPMGGIWFWTIYGTGLAALWIYQNAPQTNESPAASPRVPARIAQPQLA